MKNLTLIILICLGMFASPLVASDYLGEFCFRAETGDTSTRLMKLGVSHMGDNHYQVAGSWNWENHKWEDEVTAAINGNLEVVNEVVDEVVNTYLIATLTFAFTEDDAGYTRVARMELKASSLNGRISIIGHNSKTELSHRRSVYQVSWIPCP